MNNPFDSVKDSTIWYKSSNLSLIENSDSRLYVGIVRSVANDNLTGELRYFVEVKYKNDTIMTSCRMLRRFGGAFNYEDYTLRGYDYKNDRSQSSVAAKAGDIVLVGSFGGQSREGVILGGLSHPAKRTFLDASLGPQYRSEFNGVETHINQDGEYTLTFKGLQTNVADLKAAPKAPIAAPEYDLKVGTSYLKFDKTGSMTLNDNAEEDPQKLFIDKENGTVELISGKVSLKFTKKEESVELTTKTTLINTTDSIEINTKNSDLNAQELARMTAPDIHLVGKTFLGADSLTTAGVHDGVVTGVGIDTLTGMPYAILGNASTTVFAKK